jgi:hypothetical protein
MNPDVFITIVFSSFVFLVGVAGVVGVMAIGGFRKSSSASSAAAVPVTAGPVAVPKPKESQWNSD